MQRRPNGNLESIQPYSMAVALDSIAIILKSSTDLKITQEMVEGIKNHRLIGKYATVERVGAAGRKQTSDHGPKDDKD